MTETIIQIDLGKSPYDNDMIHNRWHPDIPMVATVKPGDDGDGQLLLLASGEVAAAPVAHLQQHRKEVVKLAGDMALAGGGETGFNVFLYRHGRKDHSALGYETDATGDPLMALQGGEVDITQTRAARCRREHADQGFH